MAAQGVQAGSRLFWGLHGAVNAVEAFGRSGRKLKSMTVHWQTLGALKNEGFFLHGDWDDDPCFCGWDDLRGQGHHDRH